MNIHQLSVNYLQEQDRILVRINTTDAAELRLWFTRRLTLGLAPLLGKIVAEHVARQEAIKSPHISPMAAADAVTQQMLADFKKQEHLQKSDFQTPFKDNGTQLPLGAEPLLVTEVNMTPLASGQMQLVFSEKLPDVVKPRSFQIALEPKLTHGFIHLLDKAIEVSLWREGVRVVQDGAAPDSALHLLDEKPKYLN
jgi:hypothetical protein